MLDDLPRLVGDVDQPLAAGALGHPREQRAHPRGGARHQDPDRRRVPDRVQVEHEQPGVEVEAGRRRAVEHPPQRPLAQVLDRERRAPGVEREPLAGRAQPLRHVRHGVEQDLRDLRQGRLGDAAGPHRMQRLAERGRLDLGQRAADRGHRHRPQQLELGVLLGARGERVQPDPAARLERHRPDADRGAQRAVLALDVEHERAPAEQEHPPQQRLDQRALALPELAEHDRVRVVERPVAVQDPRVVTERPAAGVAADEHAAAAEAAGGDERVDGLRVPGRAAVAGPLGGTSSAAAPRAHGSS